MTEIPETKKGSLIIPFGLGIGFIAVLVLSAIVAVAGLYLYSLQGAEQPQRDAAPKRVVAVPSATPTPVPTQPPSYLLDQTFIVDAQRSLSWEFRVSQPARMTGRFKADGGQGNDIICLVLSSDEFENFSNGHSVKTFYNSGQVTVGNIDIILPPGSYRIVFTNTFSFLEHKFVTAKVSMFRA